MGGRLLNERQTDRAEIARLTSGILGDYLDFFDNTAFADHADWSGCYCMFFHCESPFDGQAKANRDLAADYIRAGRQQGYLAYLDGKVVGWLNANDKSVFCRLTARSELWDGEERDKKIKAFVCILIAPEMRGRGIASSLLERTLADAAAEGYDLAEGYPFFEGDAFDSYHGPYALFAEKRFFGDKKVLKTTV